MMRNRFLIEVVNEEKFLFCFERQLFEMSPRCCVNRMLALQRCEVVQDGQLRMFEAQPINSFKTPQLSRVACLPGDRNWSLLCSVQLDHIQTRASNMVRTSYAAMANHLLNVSYRRALMSTNRVYF